MSWKELLRCSTAKCEWLASRFAWAYALGEAMRRGYEFLLSNQVSIHVLRAKGSLATIIFHFTPKKRLNQFGLRCVLLDERLS
jgi:hypothetical protein